MQLKQIMTRNVESVEPDATLQEAAEKMASLDVGFLPVMKAKVPIGVVTDRDITVRAVARGDDPRETRVSQIMTKGVQTMPEDRPVEEAARLMREKRLRRLLVEDINRRIVGVVALADLAVEVPEQRLSGRALESVSGPQMAETHS
jgi:CBS domain-containing protein